MKVTRRQLAATLAATAVRPQTPCLAATPAEELEAARERIRRNAAKLAQVKLPMDTEPAFQFKA
jgi:hypothetical protein